MAQQRKDVKGYVRALQSVVERSREDTKNLSAEVERINASYPGERGTASIKVDVQSEGADAGSLRVTCPTRSVISADVDTDEAEWIEFYLTRPGKNGKAETRLLGRAKYRDGDGRWRIAFTSERFARTPQDPLLVHAEAISVEGRLLAAHAVIVIE